jgi:hypothetical protein
MNTIVKLDIFSPRWGREDTYTVELKQDFMEISSAQMKKAKATWDESSDPVWSGESLEDIMNNDKIYPPSKTRDLFERAWKAWRDGELNDEKVKQEFQHVAGWINVTSRSQPESDFWRKYF